MTWLSELGYWKVQKHATQSKNNPLMTNSSLFYNLRYFFLQNNLIKRKKNISFEFDVFANII